MSKFLFLGQHNQKDWVWKRQLLTFCQGLVQRQHLVLNHICYNKLYFILKIFMVQSIFEEVVKDRVQYHCDQQVQWDRIHFLYFSFDYYTFGTLMFFAFFGIIIFIIFYRFIYPFILLVIRDKLDQIHLYLVVRRFNWKE